MSSIEISRYFYFCLHIHDLTLDLPASKTYYRGVWGAQSVECPTLAQVMISRFVGLSPESGSGLTAQSLEPTSDFVSPSLSAPHPLMFCLSLPLKNKEM